MKILTGLLAALVLTGLVTGCQQTPTEVTYREVSVGNMILSIPTDWQRPDDFEEIVGEFMSDMGPGMEQYVQIDGYEVSKAQDFGIVLMAIEMSKIIEAEGETWEGWESMLEAKGMTREDMLFSFQGSLIGEGAEEVTQQEKLEHTIHGCEALEAKVTCKMEGEPAIANLLIVFAKNDLGILMMLGETSACEKYEDCWYEIRDSVQF